MFEREKLTSFLSGFILGVIVCNILRDTILGGIRYVDTGTNKVNGGILEPLENLIGELEIANDYTSL